MILDLRGSAAHEVARPAGSRWTIRPRVSQTLRDADAHHATPLVLFSDAATRDATRLVANDLREAGFHDVSEFTGGLDAWTNAGLPVDRIAKVLPQAERIDYLFFVHDRHDGNLDAARAYLDWETGLIAQCEPDELAAFRVGEAAISAHRAEADAQIG
ncbi:rhodanese-like domain-containing protein [Candidatus Burkholderia verschuerenii]|uniref:rhodanese-like domain-containing protein n=1 Tax=Candidatus Burkholderia verschuerenii TaxID=242163 RepID=UPI00267EAD7E